MPLQMLEEVGEPRDLNETAKGTPTAEAAA